MLLSKTDSRRPENSPVRRAISAVERQVRKSANLAGMDWTPAVQHLAKADPRFAPIIDKHGHPTITPTRDAVQSLARAIVSQQLSGKAASTIWGRVLDLYPNRKFPKPAAILATPDTSLRAAGLSGAKAAAIKDLARHVVEAKLVPAKLAKLTDAQISEMLVSGLTQSPISRSR